MKQYHEQHSPCARGRKPSGDELREAYEKLWPNRLIETQTQYQGPCPGCRDGDDRFSIQKRDGSVWCRVCQPGRTREGARAYFAILKVLGFAEKPAVPAKPTTGGTDRGLPDSSRFDQERIARASRLWNSSASVPLADTPAREYLRQSRMISMVADSLSFNPDVFHPDIRRKLPCMLAKVVNPQTGSLTGVHQTFFTLPKIAKRCNLGKVSGGGVLLSGSMSAQAIVVVEGIEDGLAILQCGINVTVWATCGTSHMRTFKPPEAARLLLIAPDRDPEGRKAAQTLKENVKKANPKVRPAIVYPDKKDWNQMLLEGKVMEIREKMPLKGRWVNS